MIVRCQLRQTDVRSHGDVTNQATVAGTSQLSELVDAVLGTVNQ